MGLVFALLFMIAVAYIMQASVHVMTAEKISWWAALGLAMTAGISKRIVALIMPGASRLETVLLGCVVMSILVALYLAFKHEVPIIPGLKAAGLHMITVTVLYVVLVAVGIVPF